MPVCSLIYQDVPPSLNAIATHGTHWPYTKAKKRWQEIIEGLLLVSKLPPMERVSASAELTFPTRQRRDTGNFRFMLEKALGDALVNAGKLADDDADRYSFGHVTMGYEKGHRMTVIRLEYE